MPAKINVGLSKKVGQENFGSLGANCSVEFQLDGEFDPDKFKDVTRRAYTACRDAVESELSGHESQQAPVIGGQHRSAPTNRDASCTNGSSPRGATNNQIRAIHAIANRNGANLSSVLKQFNASRPSELSIRHASQVIDQLKNPSGSPAVAR